MSIENVSIRDAFENFMTESFEEAVDKSTKASQSGSGYSVELFDDGSYRVLLNKKMEIFINRLG